MKLFDPFEIQVERFEDIVEAALVERHGGLDLFVQDYLERKRVGTLHWNYENYTFAFFRDSTFLPPRKKNHRGGVLSGARADAFSTAVELLAHVGVEREELVATPRANYGQDRYATWPYYGAALARVIQRLVPEVPVKCLSCNRQIERSEKPRLFHKLVLCPGCGALAESAENQVNAHIDNSRAQAMEWLVQHIMQGGLLKGGSGDVPIVPPTTPAPAEKKDAGDKP